jgi:selenide,water dikinase
LSDNQIAAVGLEIHTLPCIAGTPEVNDQVMDFRLLKGYSAETSGGLMVCMSEESAREFCKELEERDGCKSWIIGRVVESTERKSRIVADVKVLSV